MALLLSVVALAAMIFYNALIFLLFAAIMAVAVLATVVRERRVPAFA